MKEKVSNINDFYGNIFNNILTISSNIYIYGGAIRDLLLDIKPKDIDIAFDSNIDSVKKLCSTYNYTCSKIIDKYKYVIFGSTRGTTLEGHYNILFFKDNIIDYDFTINQLVYDTENNILIDLTGHGVKDLMNKHINIPVNPDKYQEWATKNKKHPLIYFKLIEKGFSTIDIKQEKFIINYIETNFDKIYLKKEKNGIEYIKFYILSILSHVDIQENGTYFVNLRQQKSILKYITVLSKYLNKKYITKIVNLF